MQIFFKTNQYNEAESLPVLHEWIVANTVILDFLILN